MSNLEAIRQTLQQRLSKLILRHDKLEANLRHADGELSDDWEERAALLQNAEVWEALEQSDRSEIEAINAALARIKAGTYETCVSCGEEIGERRLAALPTTDRCVHCA